MHVWKQAASQSCNRPAHINDGLSHVKQSASWLTDRKEMEPDTAVINYLCLALCTIRYRHKYGAKPI